MGAILKKQSLDWRILIVDDMEYSCVLLSDILSKEGYRKNYIARDAKSAIQILNDKIVDMVLLDLVLPDSSGFEVCKHIKNSPKLNHIPVIIQSGNASSDFKKEAFSNGATDYVVKPVDQYELIARVNHIRDQQISLQSLKHTNDRIASELQEASVMMHSLLPDLEKMDETLADYGLEIDAFFQPSSELGGDFFDIKVINNNKISLLMWDFAGHGVSAAINTFRLHALIHSDQHLSNPDPGSMMSLMNESLSNLISKNNFATMFYSVYDFSKEELEYSCASCPSPLLISFRENKYKLIDSKDFPLSVVADHKYETHKIATDEWDVLILYSDALIETHDNADDLLYMDDVAKKILELKPKNAKEVKEAVLSFFNWQRIAKLKDDLTVNAIFFTHSKRYLIY